LTTVCVQFVHAVQLDDRRTQHCTNSATVSNGRLKTVSVLRIIQDTHTLLLSPRDRDRALIIAAQAIEIAPFDRSICLRLHI